MSGLRVGDSAPDLTVADHTGQAVRLSERWAGRPLVLLFVRHLGWPCAREHVVDVQRDYLRLKKAGGEVLVVTMGTPQQAAEFRAKLKTELTLLADAGREAYQAYGLRRGTWREVIGPKVWPRLLKAAIRSGAGKPVGDVWQMPGEFVIDTRGIIRYAHYPADQAERPSNEQLLTVLESLR